MTFFCCLLINIEYGILIGAIIHLLLLSHEASRTKSTCNRLQVTYSETIFFTIFHTTCISSKRGGIDRIVVKVDRNLYFPSVERLREALSAHSLDEDDSTNYLIIIDLSNVTQIDHTSLKVIKNCFVHTPVFRVLHFTGFECYGTNMGEERLQAFVHQRH